MEKKLNFPFYYELKNEEPNEEKFVKSVKSVLKIPFMFTQKACNKPKGSAPIDFAYKVHSDIGDKMVGALVNNSIAPLVINADNIY